MNSLIVNDYFEEFKKLRLGVTWKEYWTKKWTDLIDFYLSLGWKLIPITRHSKKPIAGFSWNETDWDRKTLVSHVIPPTYGNLAVVAGQSKPKLIVIDCDTIPKMKRFPDTMTMNTARGMQFYTRGPMNLDLGEKLKKKVPEIESLRSDVMYALLPLSVTCSLDAGKGCEMNGHSHDWRVRDWSAGTYEAKGKIIPFRQFVQEVLSS